MGNSGSHNSSAITNYQIIKYTKRTLYNTQSYTYLKINKPCIALNSETYISLRMQELSTCKEIGYEFYCEEIIVVKHITKYSCKKCNIF